MKINKLIKKKHELVRRIDELEKELEITKVEIRMANNQARLRL